jgi:hypothetical protein
MRGHCAAAIRTRSQPRTGVEALSRNNLDRVSGRISLHTGHPEDGGGSGQGARPRTGNTQPQTAGDALDRPDESEGYPFTLDDDE